MAIKAVRIYVKNNSNNPLPRYETLFSAGFDLRAHIDGPLAIPAKSWAVIGTGLHVEIPPGYEIQIRPRSGLAANYGITVLNTPGTIDADYRGEIKVILINLSDKVYVVNPGDRIAQGVLCKVMHAKFVIDDNLEETERGSKGFGSTGIK